MTARNNNLDADLIQSGFVEYRRYSRGGYAEAGAEARRARRGV